MAAVLLGFGFVFAQSQAAVGMLLRSASPKTPKVLADGHHSLPNGYSIFSNALACGLEGGDFWIALTGETQKEEYSEGVALGYDGSGRWPDHLSMIDLQSSRHFTREQQIMKFATTAVWLQVAGLKVKG